MNQFTSAIGSKKSAITQISNTINSSKITKNSFGTLFKNYRPKIKGQILSTTLKRNDREAIKNLALGSLTRDNMSKCDNRVLHYCIECSKNPKIKYKQTETVEHFLKCHNSWDTLTELSSSINSIMDKGIEKKLKDLKLRRALNSCKKYENFTIYNDNIDAMLGIGKIQIFSTIATKQNLKTVKDQTFKIQNLILTILRDKSRLGATYHDRLDSLLSKQT